MRNTSDSSEAGQCRSFQEPTSHNSTTVSATVTYGRPNRSQLVFCSSTTTVPLLLKSSLARLQICATFLSRSTPMTHHGAAETIFSPITMHWQFGSLAYRPTLYAAYSITIPLTVASKGRRSLEKVKDEPTMSIGVHFRGALDASRTTERIPRKDSTSDDLFTRDCDRDQQDDWRLSE